MKNKVLIGIGIIFVVFFVFYWYELRPSKIRSYCNWSVRWGPEHRSGVGIDGYEFLYKSCLRSKGLKSN